MESFNELMMRRRSSRKFTAEPIAPDQVQELLKAALVAPTSKNAHSWQFVAVEDREMLERLAACRKMGSSFLSGCALTVVVMGDVTVTDVWVEDASIAAAYMQLQAEDLGLGSCWCQVRNRHTPDDTEAEQYVRDLLDIPYQLGVLCIVGFGHRERVGRPHDEAALLWEHVHIGRYRTAEIAGDGQVQA